MKHFFQFVCLILLFSCFSCTKEIIDPVFNYDSDELSTRSDIKPDQSMYYVTKEMATYFAESFDNKPEIVSIEPYSYNNVTCLYIVNYEHGWMIISADTRVQAILGESDDECLYPDTTENEELRFWLNTTAEIVYRAGEMDANQYNENSIQIWDSIRSAIGGGLVGSVQPGQAEWVRITTVSTNSNINANVSHLLETKWGQYYPWNCTFPIDPIMQEQYGFTSRFVTGCVATAISQILYYFSSYQGDPLDCYHTISPSIATSLGLYDGSYKYKLALARSGYNSVSDRWISMPLTDNETGGNYSYVSDLMMGIGVRMNSTYSITSTGASLHSSADVSPCGISASASGYSYSTVRDNLVAGKPVIVVGYDDNIGHAWVIDGCEDYTITTYTANTYYEYQEGVLYPTGAVFLTDAEAQLECPGVYDGFSQTSSITDSNHYLLMNFGWGGSYDDGHYALNPSGTDWMGLNNSIRIFYNISTSPLLIEE